MKKKTINDFDLKEGDKILTRKANKIKKEWEKWANNEFLKSSIPWNVLNSVSDMCRFILGEFKIEEK